MSCCYSPDLAWYWWCVHRSITISECFRASEHSRPFLRQTIHWVLRYMRRGLKSLESYEVIKKLKLLTEADVPISNK